ncbi:MAG: type II/IV secretion system ATPase subunit [Candidatus Thermoplasmatota archaeon]|nr:type II/IV secretion system ATPase subunit [Candidatus Thermoplasmatota archaeon]
MAKKILIKHGKTPIKKEEKENAVSKMRVKHRKMAVKKDVKEEEISEILDKDIEEIESYPIAEPYAKVRITYNHKTHTYLYEAIEKKISEEEEKILDFIKKILSKTIDYETFGENIVERKKQIADNTDEIIRSRSIKIDEKSKGIIKYYLCRNFVGFGKIDVPMNDEAVEDISCDGSNVSLYVVHRAYESIKTNLIFETDDEVDSFVIALAQRSGKQISVADPMVDGTLPEGSRLQATLAKEVTTRGSSFTIRRFKENPLTPPDLVRYNTLSAEMMAYLWLAVEFGESIITSGGTACGKTSTMNAMMLFIPPQAKIVSIEDTREINIPHENWIAGLTRSGFGGKTGAGSGEIDMFELVKAALRQRPQYVVVGEVRGKEAFSLFQAMATGHTAYSTMHADSVRSIVNRLENPPINLPRVLLSALNIVVLQSQVMLGDRMVRRINKIVELVGLDPDTNDLITNTVYEWHPSGDKFEYLGHSVMFEKVMSKKNMTMNEMNEEFKRRTEVVNWMLKKNVRNYQEVAKIVSQYYTNPEDTIKKIMAEAHA